MSMTGQSESSNSPELQPLDLKGILEQGIKKEDYRRDSGIWASHKMLAPRKDYISAWNLGLVR